MSYIKAETSRRIATVLMTYTELKAYLMHNFTENMACEKDI